VLNLGFNLHFEKKIVKMREIFFADFFILLNINASHFYFQFEPTKKP